MKNSFLVPLALSATVSAVLAASGFAASVTFSNGTNIVGDADVSTAMPVLVGAFNVGDGGVPLTVVNGVTFQPFALNSTAGPVSNGSNPGLLGSTFTLATPDLFVSDNMDYASASPPFSSLSTGYRTLLSSATITILSPFTLTISGLVPNQVYDVQIWTNFSDRPITPGEELHQISAGAFTETILNDNVTATDGGLGQYTIGRFTADSTSQVINFSPEPILGLYAQVNAFQLRTVPEPSTALFGLALAGFCTTVRRRAAAVACKV